MIETVRRTIADRTRTLIAGRTTPSADFFVDDDPGLFGPDSAAWMVHRDMAVLVGGVRALLLQTLHPLVMAGVADHSSYRTDPLGRLHRTAGFLGATIFGSTATATAAIDQVRKIHVNVVGTAPDGRPYEAGDPRLLGWVHITEVQSFLMAVQRYGTHLLSPSDADNYVAEMAKIGIGLGMDTAPTSVAELTTEFDSYRPELTSTKQSREAVRFLVFPPLPLLAKGPYGLVLAAAVGLLPGWAQRLVRLPVLPLADPLLFRPAATVLVRTLGWALAPPPKP